MLEYTFRARLIVTSIQNIVTSHCALTEISSANLTVLMQKYGLQLVSTKTNRPKIVSVMKLIPGLASLKSVFITIKDLSK